MSYEEGGSCNFFQYCDESTKPHSPNQSRPETDFGPKSDMMCPCSVGLCLMRTSGLRRTLGCGFFLWCDEKASCGGGSRLTTAAGPMRTGTKRASWDSGGGPIGASQVIAGAADGRKAPRAIGGGGAGRGECFKRGQPGHWASDCTGAMSNSSFSGGVYASPPRGRGAGISAGWHGGSNGGGSVVKLHA
eukprot:SM000019S05052  [mRNA]  locus=s19:615362:617367:- [translate_table: standard]